jgi:hypothetical protein
MLKFENGLLEDTRIVIDGSGDRVFRRELEAYLRHHLGRGKVRSIRFRNSESDHLVQLADMCTGAIARSFRTDKDDPHRWRKMLGAKLQDVWPFR